MNDYTRKLLDKAMDTIEGAELLLDHEKVDLAAGRAYMPCFILQKPCSTKKVCSSASMVM